MLCSGRWVSRVGHCRLRSVSECVCSESSLPSPADASVSPVLNKRQYVASHTNSSTLTFRTEPYDVDRVSVSAERAEILRARLVWVLYGVRVAVTYVLVGMYEPELWAHQY